MMIRRILMCSCLTVLAAGCHLLHADCTAPQEYQTARQVPPLKVPMGMNSPNVAHALVIPSVGPVAPRPGPKDACLEAPPRFVHAPHGKAAGSG